MRHFNKPTIMAGALVLCLGLGLALGPRVPVDTTLHPLTPAEDLDAYLAQTERAYAELTPGAEKRIHWENPTSKAKTPLSLVYLHGYSATRQETAPLTQRIAEQLGANAYYTRLTGHGLPGEALARASVNDWLNDAWEAYTIGKHIGERVVVIGTSTGGTLATWLAVQPDTEGLAGLVLLSPNFGVQDQRAEILLWPWAEIIAPIIAGPIYKWDAVNERHARYWTHEYPTTALMAMMGLVELVRTAPLEDITTPTLVLYSKQDRIVDVMEIERAYVRLGAAEKSMVAVMGSQDPQQHVLAGDILSAQSTPTVASHILAFLQHVPANPDKP